MGTALPPPGSARTPHRRARMLAAAVLAAGLQGPAAAVILAVTDTGSTYSLTLRVGAVSGVDTVQFNVTGNNAGLTPTAVAATAPIDVWVTPLRPANLLMAAEVRPIKLRVDSSTGLACQSGGCGTTVIPFSKISWTASNNSAAGTGDIQSGTFNPANPLQYITSPATGFNANATTCILVICNFQSYGISATRLQFIYANDVVYPAGNYRGTVRFTATME